MAGGTGFREITKIHFLTATKDRKLWRATIAYVLRGNGT